VITDFFKKIFKGNCSYKAAYKFNSIQIYLYSAFHNTFCFKAALQKVHFRNVHGKNTFS